MNLRPVFSMGAASVVGLCACSNEGIAPDDVSAVSEAVQIYEPSTIVATLVSEPTNLTASAIYKQFEGPANMTGSWFANVRWMGDAQSNGNSIDCGPPSYEFTDEVANAVTWNPVQFTGLDCSTFGCNDTYQAGRYDDAANGSGVFQAHGADFGSFINTWYFLHRRTVEAGGPHSVLTYNLTTPTAIFTNPDYSTDSLIVQAYVTIPWAARWGAGVGQYSLAGFLRDHSGKVIEFLAYIHDTGGLPPNSQIRSAGGQAYWNVPFSSYAPLASNGKSYGHPSGYSQLGGSCTYATAKFFRFNLTQAELVNVVTDLNDTYGLGLSTVATDYELTGLHTLHEVFPGPDSATSDCLASNSPGIKKSRHQVSMGTNTSAFAAYEAY